MSVAASTSIGKGDVKTKVVFTEQGGDVCVCVIAIPVSPCSFLPLWCSVPVTGPHDIHVTRFSLSQIIVSWQPLSLERLMGSSLSTQLRTADPTTVTGRRQKGMLSVSVEHNVTRVVLDGLSPILAYSVSVSASTTAGTSTNNNNI